MVRSTSIAVYREITDNGLLSKARMDVYQALFKARPCTANELIAKGHFTRQSTQKNVWSRLGELREMGVAYEAGKKICSISGTEMIVWDVTDDLPKELIKKKTLSDELKETKARLKDAEKAIVELWKLGEPAKVLIRPYVEKYKKRT